MRCNAIVGSGGQACGDADWMTGIGESESRVVMRCTVVKLVVVEPCVADALAGTVWV
jgi:hypothetical protein